ncbi:hypothetical protein FHT03_001044 [Xanthomonas arboricola]
MGFLDGVSECWWLSSNCVINWDAWSAIGTVAATGVALFFGVQSVELQARVRRSRERIAVGLIRAIGERLFDEVESIGANEGVSRGQWDVGGHTLNFLLASATKLRAACQSVELHLLDVDERVISAWVEVLGESRGLAEDVLALEKHSPQGQKEVATHVTQAHHEAARQILRREHVAMSSVGGKAFTKRTLRPAA